MTTTVEPSGVIFTDICEVQTEKCVAKDSPSAVTAVWSTPGRTQVNVCRPCLEEMVRRGEWEVKGARIKPRADVAVFDTKGRVLLVVEVKYLRKSSPQRASEMRRNLLAHSAIPNTHFLLIAFPDWFYLWKEDQPDNYNRQADYILDARNITVTYARKNDIYLPEMTPREFELIVSDWLKDLVKSQSPQDSLEWATKSGLYDAIKDCSVAREVVLK